MGASYGSFPVIARCKASRTVSNGYLFCLNSPGTVPKSVREVHLRQLRFLLSRMQAGRAGTETICVGRRRISDWTHVATCLVSFAGGWIVSDRVAATEFSGGTVTGPILRAEYAGMV